MDGATMYMLPLRQMILLYAMVSLLSIQFDDIVNKVTADDSSVAANTKLRTDLQFQVDRLEDMSRNSTDDSSNDSSVAVNAKLRTDLQLQVDKLEDMSISSRI